MALTGFMVNVPNWNTPPSDPFPTPPDFVINNINNLSSKFGQNGGVPGLKNLNTAGLPPGPWLPPNLGESDALQILIRNLRRNRTRRRSRPQK